MNYKSIAACPNCRSPLHKHKNSFSCPECQVDFHFHDGILNALPTSSNQFRKTEEQFWDYSYEQEEVRSLENRNSAFHQHFRQPLLSLTPGATIVELACGSRLDALEVAQAGYYVIATDISQRALQHASRLTKNQNVDKPIEFIKADATHIPIASNSVDAVLMAASFHHLENPLAGLIEMKRILKNGGYIILGVEPNKWPYKTIYQLLRPLKKYIRNKRRRSVNSIGDDTTQGFSKNDFKKLFTSENIEVLEIKPVKYTLEWYDSYLRLKERLGGSQVKSSKQIQDFLASVDNILEKTPLIKNLNWHWNVIGRVKK